MFFLIALCESRISFVPQAILQLVQSHLNKSSVKIEVFYNTKSMKILDETLKLLSEVTEVKVTKAGSQSEIGYLFTFYNDAIFLFDTLDNYLKFEERIVKAVPKQKQEIHFLIFCENLTSQKIQENFQVQTFKSFLLHEKNEISLKTMTMFTRQHCRDPQLIELNRFSMKNRKWATGKFFATKFENFHGCELNFLLNGQTFPFLKYKITEERKVFNVEGVLIKMVEALATHLNFTVRYTLYDEEDVPEFDTHDLWLEVPMVGHLKSQLSFLSDPIYSTSDVFVVPPGESYTPWEKLFLPFDEPTWMWLGIVFAIAFLVILIVKISRSSSMYEFIVGSNVMTPTLNVVAIFMGIGQLFLPHRNIARMLFMVFVLFSLIMRTAYQGKYFEFITSDVRKKPISTVAELAAKNLTVFVPHVKIDELEICVYCEDLDILKG